MKKLVFLLLILTSFSNCKSSKRSKTKNSASSKVIIENRPTKTDTKIETSRPESNSENLKIPESKADGIIEYAKQFQGVRYKFGGTTEKGMDCSGLVFESFKAYNVILPRISRDMAKNGDKIELKEVLKGDLLFFKTGNRRNDISHVGLVISVGNGDIQFIHATSSSGVVISSINENYWTKAFAEARRIL